MNNEKEIKNRESIKEDTSLSLFKSSKVFRKMVWKWLLIVFLFLFCILMSLYFLSSYSQVGNITVIGTTEVYDQDVLEASRLRSGDSLWGSYFEKTEIEENIVKENPQVSDATLSFSGIQDFDIHIDEYQTVAYLSQDDSYNKILENGVILNDRTPRPTANQPILINFDEGRALDTILSEYEDVAEQVKIQISEIEFRPNERNDMLVHAYMNDGNEVIASVPSFSNRINYYPEMEQSIDGKQGVFDLEAGAYFIPYDSEEEEEEIELSE